MTNRNSISYVGLTLLCIILFVLDLMCGSVSISVTDISQIFSTEGTTENNILKEILLNIRLPKAITAIFVGAALSVAGLLMQTLFMNDLAGPDILGVSSGASLGVAITVMIGSGVSVSNWSIIISAVIGSGVILFLMLFFSAKIKNSISLLLIGIMVGSLGGAVVSILQQYSNPTELKSYIIWTLGNLSSVTWNQIFFLGSSVFLGLFIAFLLPQKLNTLLLGETYAQSLGLNIFRTRILILLATMFLAGGTTAFTGPIAFVGIAVPHIARRIFQTSNHHILMPACIGCGIAFMLLSDAISHIGETALPINAVCSLLGGPIVILVILKWKIA